MRGSLPKAGLRGQWRRGAERMGHASWMVGGTAVGQAETKASTAKGEADCFSRGWVIYANSMTEDVGRTEKPGKETDNGKDVYMVYLRSNLYTQNKKMLRNRVKCNNVMKLAPGRLRARACSCCCGTCPPRPSFRCPFRPFHILVLVTRTYYYIL